ncbi:hypothetical protein NEISUBOT_05279 [Neisseria subflava NJ9703]|uniref:Uncharacterized protein n=1 Tax=Neisseria subflava NJ9703 TaxID=546268 RepID=A0A9W5MYE8_NEISU|nr:hypothetical protein NEISUBOT_05279 [Neisseria subflava NJ9703]
MMEGDGCHTAFVLLLLSIYVEVAEANDLGGQAFFHAAAQYLVKQEFRVAIYIERFFQFALFAEDFALAVHCGAGSIKERNAFILTPVQEIKCVLVVVVHHVKAVMIHGIRTCALVENGFDIVVRQKMAAHLTDKFVFIEIMGNFTLGKVFKFFAFAQIVDGNNVGNTALVKCFDDVAANKAGRACYDNGHNEFPLF